MTKHRDSWGIGSLAMTACRFGHIQLPLKQLRQGFGKVGARRFGRERRAPQIVIVESAVGDRLRNGLAAGATGESASYRIPPIA